MIFTYSYPTRSYVIVRTLLPTPRIRYKRVFLPLVTNSYILYLSATYQHGVTVHTRYSCCNHSFFRLDEIDLNIDRGSPRTIDATRRRRRVVVVSIRQQLSTWTMTRPATGNRRGGRRVRLNANEITPSSLHRRVYIK